MISTGLFFVGLFFWICGQENIACLALALAWLFHLGSAD